MTPKGETEGEFSVAQFFADGTNEYIRRFVSDKEAVEVARIYTQNPAANMGITRRVVITDGGDYTVFEWQYKIGITYPTKEQFAALAAEVTK